MLISLILFLTGFLVVAYLMSVVEEKIKESLPWIPLPLTRPEVGYVRGVEYLPPPKSVKEEEERKRWEERQKLPPKGWAEAR